MKCVDQEPANRIGQVFHTPMQAACSSTEPAYRFQHGPLLVHSATDLIWSVGVHANTPTAPDSDESGPALPIRHRARRIAAPIPPRTHRPPSRSPVPRPTADDCATAPPPAAATDRARPA